MKIYYVGLIQNENTAVLQFRQSIDCLSCEILEYLGQRETTKTNARARLQKTKDAVLVDLNKRYPIRNFTNVVIA